jgi:uncharacterized membrane protein YedE/YeeE
LGSAEASIAAPPRADRVLPLGGPNVVGLAGALIVAGTWYLASAFSWRQGALFLVGVGAGVVLYHAAFGFTSAWRAVIATGRGEALRAQMLMLAATCLVFLPVLARGEIFGQAVRGWVAPVGLSVVAGAFLFGVGMQLGGGCASGTLYSAGGGSLRMLVTLAAFIAGSVIGVLHMPFWDGAPAYAPISLLARYGAFGALAISLASFAMIVALSFAVERWRTRESDKVWLPGSSSGEEKPSLAGSWLRGPWPLAVGALGLAAVNVATLLLAGRPWGVTSAFALWGSKILAAAGVEVAAWPYWLSAARAAELRSSVFRDVTSVMDFGIILGALAAAGLAGRFAPTWRVPLRSLLAALCGGLMLGYGARIAYGCNIGAYFSGIASSSLHGWLWFAAAFIGNIAGTRLRPWFGLRV